MSKEICASCLEEFDGNKSEDVHPTVNMGNVWMCKPCVEKQRSGEAFED